MIARHLRELAAHGDDGDGAAQHVSLDAPESSRQRTRPRVRFFDLAGKAGVHVDDKGQAMETARPVRHPRSFLDGMDDIVALALHSAKEFAKKVTVTDDFLP